MFAICRSRGFARLRESYGRSSVGQDGTESGWLTRNGADLDTELEGQSQWIDWRTTSFKEGDVLVLHQDLLHMTACNKSELYRISCDTRWQPSSQALDPRLGTWSSFAVEWFLFLGKAWWAWQRSTIMYNVQTILYMLSIETHLNKVKPQGVAWLRVRSKELLETRKTGLLLVTNPFWDWRIPFWFLS